MPVKERVKKSTARKAVARALPDRDAEWLEADGLGGFASGTVGGARSRRYHALLLTATTPPTGRRVLVNGFDAWVERDGRSFALSTQRYLPDVRHPDGESRLADFRHDPWPRWVYRLEDGTRVEQQLFAVQGEPRVAVSWKLLSRAPGVKLIVRPFISGRDYHSLQHENAAFRFDAEVAADSVTWWTYEGGPGVGVRSNGVYTHEPTWYRQFLYREEQGRGLDFSEDLASPGAFAFDLSTAEAIWLLEARPVGAGAGGNGKAVASELRRLRAAERRRRKSFPSTLHKAADAYLVRRGSGKTIVAGYPWFTDWGRDTFIAMRGLCLATGHLDEARDILVEWAAAVSAGMLPNRFADQGDEPEFNSVDASLWYVVAVHDYLEAERAAGRSVDSTDRRVLDHAVQAILAGYAAGTRFGIRVDADGLLAAGEPGVQLTWMDAKVGDWVVTPRIGKPVEVQALWLNALRVGGAGDPRWGELFRRGSEAFAQRFWNPERGCLYDVVDVDHQPGAVDPAFRPNQILAIGGLPYPVLDGDRARQVVEAVEARLLTPVGLRSLAEGEPGYVARYEGGVLARDGAYHQGTVWPWLLGPFVEAWLRVRGRSAAAKKEARRRFLEPLLAHLEVAGLGHVSEIADAEPPHTPRGCPFQAWSVGEALRIDTVMLGESTPRKQGVGGK